MECDTLIVGAGMSGLCVAARLKESGFSSFLILEQSDGVGGTWKDNSYPGCACDIPSVLYSFSFAPPWPWSRRYAAQSEILRYLQRFVQHNGLAPHLRFHSEVKQAHWIEPRCVWVVSLESGETFTARKLVSAMGGLQLPFIPPLDGTQHFQGSLFHSARWEHGVPLKGKRIAVVGSGASAVQIVPQLAPQARRLRVFQRTPTWVLPRVDRDFDEHSRKDWMRRPVQRAVRRYQRYLAQEAITLLMRQRGLGTMLLEREASKHLHRQIPDIAIRELLRPSHAIGCKRILLSSDYYPSFNRDNVDLVTTPISRLTENAIVTIDGLEYPTDVIVCATGFIPNGFPTRVAIVGREGQSLQQAWSDLPRAYLGMSVHGFPNLFVMTGPNTGLGHNSLLIMIEAQAQHIVKAQLFMQGSSTVKIEVREGAEQRYFREVHRRLSRTVWRAGGCRSWYQTAEGANAAIWPGLSCEYAYRARRFDSQAYTFSKIPATA